MNGEIEKEVEALRSATDLFETALAKAKRKKKPNLPWPFVDNPLPASILCIDPGSVSGWALWIRGELVSSGHVDVFADPLGVDSVLSRFKLEEGPLLIAIERPFGVARVGAGGGSGGTAIGAGDLIWRMAIKRHKLHTRMVRVYPATWRSKALGRNDEGKSWCVQLRKDVRAEEQRVARVIANREDIHPDTAPAICIGKWAQFAGELYAKLPKKFRTKECA